MSISLRLRCTTPGACVRILGLRFGAGDRDRTSPLPRGPRPDGPRHGRGHARPVTPDEPRGARCDLPPGDGRGDSRGTHPRHGHPVAGNQANTHPVARRPADVAGQGHRARSDQRRQPLLRRCAWSEARFTRARAGSMASHRLVLDYSQTSLVYANNRDEIRQVAPGLFLGLMYDRTTAPPGLVMYFALESRP